MNNDLIFRIAKTLRYDELKEMNVYLKQRINYIENKNNISVKDWLQLNNHKLSVRLLNCFREYTYVYPNDKINDITQDRAYKVNGIGKKSWAEYKKIRDELNL